MKIAVFLGGCSMERNVSLASGCAVKKALENNGHTVKLIDPALGSDQTPLQPILENFSASTPITLKDLSLLPSKNIINTINSKHLDDVDVVFLALHGEWGEDGKIQSLLEMRGIPYTGSGVMSSALTMDKGMTKILMQHFGIKTPNWFILNSKNYDESNSANKIKNEIGFPAVIKPNDQGSTVGLTIVKNVDEVSSALKLASQFGKSILIEEFIPGRELTVTIINNEAYPIIEIKPQDGFYDYKHKYTKGMTEYLCPAPISEELTKQVQAESLKLFQISDCKGFARVDFRLKDDSSFYCLEINTLPGMTETSLVPKSAAAKGIKFSDLCQNIVDSAITEFKNK
ncbi:MAG: D-alanine--D-alanine ligase [Bacteroidetes bacterium]|nr:D-alanine--D-alanine ligase [Bacteroidota bacterium]